MHTTHALNHRSRRRLLYMVALFVAPGAFVAFSGEAQAQDCAAEFNQGYACVYEDVALESVTRPTGISDENPQGEPIALPFNFQFLREARTEVCVHAHGFLDFDCAEPETPLDARADTIFAYGAPMVVGQGSVTYGTVGEAPQRRFVVAWSYLSPLGTNARSIVVQAALHEGSHDVVIEHWSVSDSAEPVVVGLVANPGELFNLSGDRPGPIWGGRGYRLSTHLFEIPQMAPPNVQIEAPETVSEGDRVEMTADGVDLDLDPLTYTWDLDGDGVFDDAQGADVSWQAGSDGVVRTGVKVTDGVWTIVRNFWVTVENAPPVLVAPMPVLPYVEGSPIRFAVEATDPGRDNVSFTWSWGDGSAPEPSESVEMIHVYADQGEYDVTVVAIDEDGARAEETLTIVVENLPPVLGPIDGARTALEGDTVAFAVEVSDQGDDSVQVTWDFADGAMAMGLRPQHRFDDDGHFEVRVTAQDEDSGVATQTFVVDVANVAPTIVSEAPLQATQYQEYSYALEVTDPGDDVISYELLNAPRGMALTDGALRWTPDADQAIRGEAFVMVRVDDGDGGTDVQLWDIAVEIADSDGDGMSDDCEDAFGFARDDASDASGDDDQDNLSNLIECQVGTHPKVFNGPTKPALSAPVDNQQVATRRPTLIVAQAHDPDDDPLTYTFQVYADAALTEPVIETRGQLPIRNSAAWEVDGELEENASYWWRARAADPYVEGEWSETGQFTVDVTNEPPSIPVGLSPQGDVDERQPIFRIDPSVDPEGDAVVYAFTIFADAALSAPVLSGQTMGDAWTPGASLADNTAYWWQVVAEDERGARSAPSPALAFILNTTNDLPPTPEIVSPEPGFESDASSVSVVWRGVDDPDGDPITYTVEVAADPRFTKVVFAADETPEAGADTYDTMVSGLEEDHSYHVRVRAADPHGASLYTRRAFSVNAVNEAPYPSHMLSPADSVRLTPGAVELIATRTSDPDGDAVSYSFQVFSEASGESPVFEQSDVVVGSDGTLRATFEAPEVSAAYSWVVIAEDAQGNSAAAPARAFTIAQVENQAPTAPISLTPIFNIDVNVLTGAKLSIVNVVDPDDEPVTYTFQVYTDAALTDMVWERPRVPEDKDGITSVLVSGLNPNISTYYWLAFATDVQGLQGASSSVARFHAESVQPEVPAISDSGCSTLPSQRSGGAPLAALLLALGAIAARRRG